MASKMLIIETFFDNRPQNFYYLMLPGVGEDGFYRAAMSFNAFFQSMRNPHANVTTVRQFTASVGDEIAHRKAYTWGVDWKKLKTFESIWEFYEFIGYDYKKRKYKSGEVMKVFNGRHFVVPKRRA